MPPNLEALPAALRPPVALAWAEYLARAGTAVPDFPPEIETALPLVWSASPFVAQECVRRPALLAELLESGRLLRPNREGEYAERLGQRLDGIAGETELMAVLRRFRNLEMVRIAWRDIAGWAGLEETLRDLSLLAETCVRHSLDFLFKLACAARGTPVNAQGEPQSLVVLGMGKLGAWELNFSSDIDLIFAYRDDGILPDKKATHYSEFYARLARNLVKVLDAITEDGFVFRVDTRLRPFGESGPPVMSFAALEAYYQGQAREWERYAMVKARTIAGDVAAGAELESFLRPFVYRRYLDYRALGELRELKQKISRELARQDRQDNVKLGPGGIREIEFIGQAFQLIRGGQEPRLRERRILRVLDSLGELRLLPVAVVARLQAAYRQLRTVENRLQQYADRQTHDLPHDPRPRLAIAHALGHADWEGFKRELDAVRAGVDEIFRQVVTGGQAETAETWALHAEREPLLAALANLGWQNPEPAALHLERFRTTHAVRHLTQRGEAELRRLLPKLLRATAATDPPEAVLERLLGLLEAISSRNVYLTLLAENPEALAQLVRLAAGSPWIVNTIARHPLLLDELLDPRSLYTPLSKAELECDLARRLAAANPDDPEQLMIVLRQFKQANVLRVAAADLSGAIPIMVVSDYLTTIAETVLAEALAQSWRMTAAKHGPPPCAGSDQACGFAVVAYGKLGGFELGYGSDLDLVFLYDGHGTTPTTGAKPVTSAEFYARVGKRIIHLLTTNTPAGVLYEVDLRLRPSGNSGLLVSSLEAYENYQMQSAWTWEQQALVKARCVAGDPKVGEKFRAIRAQSLCRPRDAEQLRAEVRDMREKMRANLGSKEPGFFNLKQDSGGIVDIEFLVQFGVLSGAQDRESLTEWTDVVRQLDSLTAAGFLDPDAAGLLRRAYCQFRERIHRAALLDIPTLAPTDQYPELRAEVQRLWRDHMER
ncbi:glutamate-ammonia-ligase adenylyltransferase [Methylomagnum ishizawai]|uniref:Bifunctional glutamine synthetase adenylyltransferase/adenylyl-removing enzyme n=1 Tax=Methylomagnum ishizawai TaxID=1760988 RepID=A0A1Y6CWP2_9GAMM|nr:bifunctional [glutamate--ammonia ligase]-adenylyl-L-tyrosine phosphorylase/[glutamate--ammonia-ligase] adenylyltransferase [Methylomagnum ishizawai]SMF95089.1 glutamate-ammonia-ligase adenylyltransferase [Methylomagnum ishizawai]